MNVQKILCLCGLTLMFAMIAAARTGAKSPGGVIYLGGTWQWGCCNERYGGLLSIAQTGNKLSGSFENGNGSFEGEVNGTTVTWHHDIGTGRDYRLTVTPDGQKMTGSFTGYYTQYGSDFSATLIKADGKAPPPTGDTPPPPGPDTKVQPGTGQPSKDLTGLWKNPGGNGVYRVRQVGGKFVWLIDAVAIGSYANMFQGQINGNTIDGVWEDLPGSPTIGGGRMLLKIESECRFTRVSSVNTYGANVWVKQNSICDVVGLAQKSTPSDRVVMTDPLNKPATQNTATSKPKPKVEEIPDDVIEGKPTNRATNTGTNTSSKPKPKVEEISDNLTTASATNKSVKPKAEEIPDDQISPVTTTGGSNGENTTTANTNPVATPRPMTPKPTGSCSGGKFGLGAAVPNPAGGPDGYKIPWSLPFGATGYQILLFRAGTKEFVTNTDLPNNQNGCGLSWELYFDARAPYDAYIYQGTTTPVFGPVPISRIHN